MGSSWLKFVGIGGLACLMLTEVGGLRFRSPDAGFAAGCALISIESVSSGPKILPSTALESLANRRKLDPAVSAKDLADLGNELIRREGFNFSFNTCSIAQANHSVDLNGSDLRPFSYTLTDDRGKKFKFQLMVKGYEAGCGCDFEFPAQQVSRDRMTIIADGAPIQLVRPKNFSLDEIELVDRSGKRTIRKWYNHFDMPPIGISQDGTKIYLATGYDALAFDDLAVEIGATGTPRLIPITDPNIVRDHEIVTDFPKDPNCYLGFFRFKGKTKSYLVKFSYPCT